MTEKIADGPQALQQTFVEALAANDAVAVAECYADDAVCYSMDEMVGIGPDFVRQSWSNFFSVYAVKDVMLTDTNVAVFGDTAASWGLFRMLVQTSRDGDEFELHGRFTDVARDVNGRWLYIADHASVPLPPE